MIFSLFQKRNEFYSDLFDEKTFYRQFFKDLNSAKNKIIIESPFITTTRNQKFYDSYSKLISKVVSIKIITRDPMEHDEIMRYQATEEILTCKEMGVDIVLIPGYQHRKLAIIDDCVLWEGSLNILSQNISREFMRRILSESEVKKIKKFLKY